MSEAVNVRQDRPMLKCCLKDIRWFKTSAVPPELQNVPFKIPVKEFEMRFNAEVFRLKRGSEDAVPTQFERLYETNVTILDIAPDNRVCIGWSWYSRGNGTVFSEHATGAFSQERVTSIIQYWQGLLAIKEARLDDASVDVRRCEVIRQKGLDEETVRAKRAEAIRKAELDDESVKTARELIQQRLHAASDSIHPPASKPN